MVRQYFLKNFSGKVQFEQTSAEEKLFCQLIDRPCSIDKFQIFVKTFCGKSPAFDVHAEDNEHVKNLIEQIEGME